MDIKRVVKKELASVTLSRTLGVWEVTLLGVGALLGGGIFTLLGHTAGLAGGGLVLSMLLGAFISFLNLNSYVSLATTFPQAGGGYVWVREGLGDLQGFLSGWFSWMASSVACALYAVSFGIFAKEFLFSLVGLPDAGFSSVVWQVFLAVLVVLIFGLINYRGVSLSGKIGGYISLFLLAILLFFIGFGFRKIIGFPEVFVKNFSPFLPFGLVGVLQAAGLFYIAFEGSEIQAQAGEEAKDPSRTLKIGLFSSWIIVSTLYLLVALVIVGATDSSSEPSWRILGEHGERAIIESAKQFMPWGYVLMIFGGLLANIAALNATIYSSSRVVFAMARDKFVWSRLGEMHELNQTPYRAILLSLGIIIFVSLFLPLKDIAGAADVLFIALFIQLNIAYLQLRRKKPEAKWHYVVPYGAILPIVSVILYLILGAALFHISPIGIYFTVFWLLLGLINYFGYTKTIERENLEKDVMYEHTMRFHERSNYKIIVPAASEEYWQEFIQIPFAMAQSEEGDVLILRIHEVPPTLPLTAGFHTDHERRILDKVEQAATSRRINVDTRLLAARSIPEAILDTIKVENGDLLVLGWDGYVNTKGFIFGRKVDVVLHRAKCDLIVVKLRDLDHMRKIFVPVDTEDNPNLRFAGKVATALVRWFGGEVTLGMVVPEKTINLDYARYHAILEDRLREMKLKIDKESKLKLIRSDHIASAIIKEGKEYDVLLLPAARGRLTKTIGMGSIPEQVAKHCDKTVIMAKGHRGITQPFWDYVRSRF